MIITVSREKIAHEIIRLRQEKAKLEKMSNHGGGNLRVLASGDVYSGSSAASTASQNQQSLYGRKKNSTPSLYT
jgi:hypothetical protein